MERRATENQRASIAASRLCYGSDLRQSTDIGSQIYCHDEDRSHPRETILDPQEHQNIRPSSVRHPISEQGSPKKQRTLFDAAEHGKLKRSRRGDHPERVRGSRCEAHAHDEKSTSLAVADNMEAGSESSCENSQADAVTESGGSLEKKNIDENLSKRELLQQERSKRKRLREKQRRSDVNKAFDDLMALLKTIDHAAAVGDVSNKDSGVTCETAPSTPQNRVVLISRTVNILERLYHENHNLKHTVRVLWKAQEPQAQPSWTADERMREACSLGAQQGDVFQVLGQECPGDKRALLQPEITYDTPARQTTTAKYLPLFHVTRNDLFPSVAGVDIRGALQNASAKSVSYQQLPFHGCVLQTANRASADLCNPSVATLLDSKNKSQYG